jgi:CheY-like chemotaxis protein
MVVQGVPGHAKLKPITVMVVDDHPALRAGLRSLIESDPALCVLVEVGSGEAAYAEYRSLRPDTVVMDLSMEGFGGIEAIRRIRDLDPQAAILVYSVHNSQVLLERHGDCLRKCTEKPPSDDSGCWTSIKSLQSASESRLLPTFFGGGDDAT